MAWNTPITWANGQTVSETHMNSLRDNLNILWPYTATGDLAYRNSSSELSKLAIGTEGYFLKSVSGVPAWSALPTKVNFVSSGLSSWENASWNGDTKNIGEYLISANDFNANIPVTAIALSVTVSARWATASDGSLLNIVPGGAGSGGNCLLVRSMVSNFFNDNQGIVPLVSGNFTVHIVGANTSGVYISVWGYFI